MSAIQAAEDGARLFSYRGWEHQCCAAGWLRGRPGPKAVPRHNVIRCPVIPGLKYRTNLPLIIHGHAISTINWTCFLIHLPMSFSRRNLPVFLSAPWFQGDLCSLVPCNVPCFLLLFHFFPPFLFSCLLFFLSLISNHCLSVFCALVCVSLLPFPLLSFRIYLCVVLFSASPIFIVSVLCLQSFLALFFLFSFAVALSFPSVASFSFSLPFSLFSLLPVLPSLLSPLFFPWMSQFPSVAFPILPSRFHCFLCSLISCFPLSLCSLCLALSLSLSCFFQLSHSWFVSFTLSTACSLKLGLSRSSLSLSFCISLFVELSLI